MRFCTKSFSIVLYSFCNFCQFLTGALIVICGVQNWRYSSRLYHLAHGIWGGTMVMLSASHNLACVIAEMTMLEILRQTFDVLVASLVVPILTLLFALEYMSDSYYSHFSDNFYCEGCFSMHWHAKIYEKVDVNSSIDVRLEIQPYEFYSHVVATLKCNEPLVTQLCHPNVQAVTFDICGFMANAMLFILLVPLNSIKSYYIGYRRHRHTRIHSISVTNAMPKHTRVPHNNRAHR